MVRLVMMIRMIYMTLIQFIVVFPKWIINSAISMN